MSLPTDVKATPDLISLPAAPADVTLLPAPPSKACAAPVETWETDAPAPREGQALKAGLVVCAVAFLTVLVAPPFLVGLGCGGSRLRNSAEQANLKTVQMALEQYATDHKGHYPAAGEWVSELTREHRNYLPSDKMPHSPWGLQPQVTAISLHNTGLPTASEVASSRKAPLAGQVVGRGEVPDGAPKTAFQFGAILYDMDPATDTYVLYGIGQKNKIAQVAKALSNVE